MSLEPIKDHVLLEIVTRVDQFADGVKSESGLLIAREQVKQDEPQMGIVYAIGSDVPADAAYKVGDKVVFNTKEIFQGFEWEDKRLCSMLHEEILAIVTEEPA